MSRTNSESRNGREIKQRELSDEDLKEVAGGVFVGPSVCAILIGLLIPR
jgi:hypothetical protein